MMKIPLDRAANLPVYLQIRDRLSQLILSGALQPGDRLPSIRTLAQNAQVNKLTVVEAYSVLEADGLIHARQGSGYFVNCQTGQSLPQRAKFSPVQEVVVREITSGSAGKLYLASIQARKHPETIDFSIGVPLATHLEDLQRQARRAMKGIGEKSLFHYDFPQGQLVLRQQIAQILVAQGLNVSPDQLMVTNGSKQALSLYFHYHLRPGDWVVVECPTYHGAIELLAQLGVRTIGIPMTSEGMNLDLLQQYLHTHHPKLIYTITTLHNPTGITTSLEHRQRLLALAEEYNCLLLEDNAYEGLNFEPVPPPLKALDRRDIVTYVNTFSKTLMPGLRVGYMVVTGRDYTSLIEEKILADYHTSTLSQAVVSEYLASGHYRRHLNSLRESHLQRRNAMLSAMETHFPAEVTWTVPQGGLFLWVLLPEEISLPQLCQQAFERNVLIAPGSLFSTGQCLYKAMRLNFSHSPEAIEQGIAILGKLLREQLNL